MKFLNETYRVPCLPYPSSFGTNCQKKVCHSALPIHVVNFIVASPTGRTYVVWSCLRMGTEPVSFWYPSAHSYSPHSPILILSG